MCPISLLEVGYLRNVRSRPHFPAQGQYKPLIYIPLAGGYVMKNPYKQKEVFASVKTNTRTQN